MNATPTHTRSGSTPGNAVVIASTPPATDTDTVRT